VMLKRPSCLISLLVILSAIFLFNGLAQVSTAAAETVFVRSGQNEGQGWVFRHSSGCWGATPGHVIADGPSASAILVGPQGLQAQVDRIFRHPKLDLAILRLTGTLANRCPGSSLGDRNEDAILRRVNLEGAVIKLERRSGKPGSAEGVSYGVEFVEVTLASVSEVEPTFAVKSLDKNKNQIVQMDSGSPLRFTGTGIGEAGLPLGLVLSTDETQDGIVAFALRMDAVRAFFETMVLQEVATSSLDLPPSTAPFGLAGFSGDTPDTACGPTSLLAPAPRCGWRADRKSLSKPVELTLDLGKHIRLITGIEIQFASNITPTGIAISTMDQPNDMPSPRVERYCARRMRIASSAC
jgi:hypothetical protein